jgi:membrane associated rhomboid family serine protease
MPPQDGFQAIGLVRPGRALISVMVLLGALWLLFAVGLNWAGASDETFRFFLGNTRSILHGEVWRLFTAPLMHDPSAVSHILWAELGLLFLAPTLEQHWGSARLLRFLFFSGVLAYAFQMLCELALPASIAGRLVPEYWFGSFPVLEAVAIAWASSFRGQVVRIWGIFPMSASTMIAFILAMSVLRVVVQASGPEGLLAPFGGMFAGWLLGGGTPSPLRKAYLKLRLAQLERDTARSRRAAPRRKRSSPFQVIQGGRGRASDQDENGNGSSGRLLH